jgi:hypothetical protein
MRGAVTPATQERRRKGAGARARGTNASTIWVGRTASRTIRDWNTASCEGQIMQPRVRRAATGAAVGVRVKILMRNGGIPQNSTSLRAIAAPRRPQPTIQTEAGRSGPRVRAERAGATSCSATKVTYAVR